MKIVRVQVRDFQNTESYYMWRLYPTRITTSYKNYSEETQNPAVTLHQEWDNFAAFERNFRIFINKKLASLIIFRNSSLHNKEALEKLSSDSGTVGRNQAFHFKHYPQGKLVKKWT